MTGQHLPPKRQDDLQSEADEVAADLGLAALLATRGRPVRVGAAVLGLMVRRDLDITVICPKLDAATTTAVARIGAELAIHERVRQVCFRNDTGHWNTDPCYPDGLYLGMEYCSLGERTRTLDIWFVDEPERQPDLAHLDTACDEDAYRILSAPGQAVSGVDDQNIRVLGRARRWQRPERVTAMSAAGGVCPAQVLCCRTELGHRSSQISASDMSAATAVYAPDQPRLRTVFRSSSQAQ